MPVVVPIRILQGLLYVVGAYFLCASSVLFIRKIVSVPPEVSRKLLHLSAIIVLTVWLYAFADWRITEVTIVVFAVAAHSILLLLLSIKDRSIEDRPTASSLSNISSERSPGELHKSLSASYLMFMLAVGVCWGLLGDRNLALASIFAWGPGDAAAALVGKRYGKNKIGKMRRKSLEGTLAMLVLSWVSVFAVLSWNDTFSSEQALLVSALTATVTTAAELATSNGLDTFFCPAAAMLILCPAHLLFQ